MEECELAKAIVKAYNKAESRWQVWRKLHPNDIRRGLDFSGSSEEESIATNWCSLQQLFDEWKSTHPITSGYFWGINCNNGPIKIKSVGAESLAKRRKNVLLF